jgi:hypothetical protein
VGLIGAPAIGPELLAVGLLLCVVISLDPREAMMPYIVNALRIAENAGVKRGRLAAAMSGTLIIGLIAGLITVLWLQYDRGVSLNDSWGTRGVPKGTFQYVDTQVQELKADGILEQVESATWAQRLRFIRPNKSFATFLVTGFVLFSVCAFLRMRFPKWPLHPILFLTWFTYPLMCIHTSFLIGWAMKSLIVKFGGANAYQRVKPLMVGLIAGDLTGGLIFMIAGAVYYFITGYPPAKYSIFPG